MFGINRNFEINLDIHRATLEYVAGLDPQKTWNATTISGKGSSKSHMEVKQKRMNNIKEVINQSEIQRKLAEFTNEVLKLFHSFRNDKQEIINKYIGDKHFYFIVGSYRTGGTYILNEMSKAVNYPVKKLLHSMVHDSMPYTKYILGKHINENPLKQLNKMGWRKPNNYYNLLFQVCQFLVYIKRVAGDKKYIVKKKEYFSCCIGFLNEIFGESASYVVTVRHPAAVVASRAESFHWAQPDQKNLNLAFKTWQACYTELLRDGVPKGEVIPVNFGPDMDTFLYKFFQQHNYDGEPEGIRITPRNYDYEFWQQKEILDKIKKVKQIWKLNGLDFPISSQIL